jgi:hypothetical protein
LWISPIKVGVAIDLLLQTPTKFSSDPDPGTNRLGWEIDNKWEGCGEREVWE